MTRRKRPLLIWVGSGFGIIAVTAIVFVATLDWNKAKPYITATASKVIGRQLRIDGDLNVKLGWISRVSARQIQLENASWSKHPQMIEVGAIDVQVDLWQLLRNFRLVLPSVTISEPNVILEKNAAGSANWDLGAAHAVTTPVPDKRTNFPVVQKLIIKDGAFFFDNQETKTQLQLKLTYAEASGFLQQPVKLKVSGIYQKLPFSLSLDGGSYENLRSATDPYPLRINLGVGKLKANLNGNLTEPLAMKGEDVGLNIQGDDMSNLFPLIHLVFPSTPPYRLKGHLKHEGDTWSFSNFSGRVGNSDLAGTIRVNTEPKRPVMKADLVSNVLDFKDLAGFIGGKPETAVDRTTSDERKKQTAATEKESDRIFPDEHYDLERLRAMDADIRLRAKRILAPNLPIDDLNAKLSLNDGVLKFDPAIFGVANGRFEIYSTFDGSKQPSKVNIDARLHHLDLKRFLTNAFAQKTIGPIGGRIMLSGTGQSFRELMATASGNTFVVMSGGEISDLLVRLAGLNVARALGVLVRGDRPIPIRCALLDLQGKNGQMEVQKLIFDTANTVVSGEGKIDLRDEKLDIVLTPVPKDFSPFSLRSFIRVNGTLKHISAFPDPIKIGTDSLFKKIVNVLTMLVLSPVQPRDLGLGKDADCAALIASIQKNDPHGVVLKDFAQTGRPNKLLENQALAPQQQQSVTR